MPPFAALFVMGPVAEIKVSHVCIRDIISTCIVCFSGTVMPSASWENGKHPYKVKDKVTAFIRAGSKIATSTLTTYKRLRHMKNAEHTNRTLIEQTNATLAKYISLKYTTV